jgi:hypothetical protein
MIMSCSPSRKLVTSYYQQHSAALDKMEHDYKDLYQQKRFALQFTDKQFRQVSVEIITDTLKYVYVFGMNEPRLTDTLKKYGLNPTGVHDLINEMRAVHCTWINNLDYYTGLAKHYMVFMSIWKYDAKLSLTKPKYYILAYFNTRQYFDKEGRLLAGRRLRKVRKINEDIFWRINERVCYTISANFR